MLRTFRSGTLLLCKLNGFDGRKTNEVLSKMYLFVEAT